MSNTDYFVKVGNPGTATTLASPGHNVGDTTFKVGSTTNWPNPTAIFAVDSYTNQTVNGQTVQVRTPGTYTEWEADVTDATTLSNAVIRYGSDQSYLASSFTRVYIPVASSWVNRLIDGILLFANQDGTLKNITAAGATITSGFTVSGGVVSLPTGSVSSLFSKIPYKSSASLTGSNPTIPANTATKVAFNTESYDTGSNYDNTTNYRFTAPAAGFYRVVGHVRSGLVGSGGPYRGYISLYKNGTEFRVGDDTLVATNGVFSLGVTDLLSLNATDYVEIFVTFSVGQPLDGSSAANNYFTVSLEAAQ